MEQIVDYEVYTERMRKAALDKMWFLDRIGDCRIIVDYGCADGSLIGFMMERYPGRFRYVGVDCDEEMLRRARERLPEVTFVTPAEFAGLGVPTGEACLCCSSVVHEVYSYGDAGSVVRFWEFVFGSGFQYVAIRDMAVRERFTEAEHRWAAEAAATVRASAAVAGLYEDYLRKWGIAAEGVSPKDVVHFLLKYRYVENWEREVREDYLPLSVEEVRRMVPEDRYGVGHFEHFVLPFLREQVARDFGVELLVETHYKLLLRRI